MSDFPAILAELLIRLHQRTRCDLGFEPLGERRRRCDLAGDLEPVDKGLGVVVLCVRLEQGRVSEVEVERGAARSSGNRERA